MKRKCLLSIALLLAFATCTMVWFVRERPHPKTIFLADGSQLEFLEATWAPNCAYNYGSFWQQLAGKLPKKWAQRLGGNVSQNMIVNAGYAGDSTAVFWFTRHGMPSSVKPSSNVVYRASILGKTLTFGSISSGPSAADGLAINLKDEQGNGIPGLRQFSAVTLPSGDSAVYWQTDMVPSASRVVFLKLYEHRKESGWKCIGQIEVPNPFLHAKR